MVSIVSGISLPDCVVIAPPFNVRRTRSAAASGSCNTAPAFLRLINIPRAKDRKDIQLVGIIEPRADLVSRYAKRYQLDSSLLI